mgnify:FL=1|jgi:uncharacterized membrane protein
MFSKTLISLACLFLMLFGLLLAIQEQRYTLFILGVIAYCLCALSESLCSLFKKLRQS